MTEMDFPSLQLQRDCPMSVTEGAAGRLGLKVRTAQTECEVAENVAAIVSVNFIVQTNEQQNIFLLRSITNAKSTALDDQT